MPPSGSWLWQGQVGGAVADEGATWLGRDYVGEATRLAWTSTTLAYLQEEQGSAR
jgi:hypothetical protein